MSINLVKALQAFDLALQEENINPSGVNVVLPYRDYLRLQMAVKRDLAPNSLCFVHLSDEAFRVGNICIEPINPPSESMELLYLNRKEGDVS